MKKREEIPIPYTWDLSPLYPDQAAWEKDLQYIQELADQLAAQRNKLASSAPNLLAVLQKSDELSIRLEWAGSYARMAFDVEMSNDAAKSNYEKIDNVFTKIGDQLAFYEPELLATLTPELFQNYIKQVPALAVYSFMFEKLFKQKEHVLSTQEEEIMALMGSLGGSFRKVYDDLTVNDLVFPEIEGENGEKITANEANYRKILGSYDRSLRERYFKGLLSTYGSHINSLTSITYGNVKYHIHTAKTRKYPSSRHMALEGNFIPPAVYDTLIATVRENVGILQDYLKFRKQVLGYDDLHFYDLFAPLVPDLKESFTFESARDTVLEALSVLGPDYRGVLSEAFAQRWIDVYPNKGKASGAYANGIYGLHPYSLLNFNGTLEDLFTMAHELGHVMHSYYSNKTQPYVDADYVIFTAEVASTVNEYFLFRHLLQKTTDPKMKAHLLSLHLDSIRSTLYRQSFFADFEMQMHKMAEEDIPLTPELLCGKYRELYEHYHGPDFVIDKELTFEWARIPHFYNSFYVYQYATGISAAIALAKNILAQKPQALASYLRFLSRGGSDYPIPLLKEAGVDMSTSTPVIAALQDFSETLVQLRNTL